MGRLPGPIAGHSVELIGFCVQYVDGSFVSVRQVWVLELCWINGCSFQVQGLEVGVFVPEDLRICGQTSRPLNPLLVVVKCGGPENWEEYPFMGKGSQRGVKDVELRGFWGS